MLSEKVSRIGRGKIGHHLSLISASLNPTEISRLLGNKFGDQEMTVLGVPLLS